MEALERIYFFTFSPCTLLHYLAHGPSLHSKESSSLSLLLHISFSNAVKPLFPPSYKDIYDCI